jgi:hypothetical protein
MRCQSTRSNENVTEDPWTLIKGSSISSQLGLHIPWIAIARPANGGAPTTKRMHFQTVMMYRILGIRSLH